MGRLERINLRLGTTGLEAAVVHVAGGYQADGTTGLQAAPHCCLARVSSMGDAARCKHALTGMRGGGGCTHTYTIAQVRWCRWPLTGFAQQKSGDDATRHGYADDLKILGLRLLYYQLQILPLALKPVYASCAGEHHPAYLMRIVLHAESTQASRVRVSRLVSQVVAPDAW
jgi:hypothetical protein